MTDIQLYQHCEEYIHEVHKFDGMCFVEPYNYQEFVQGLDIQDSESGFDAYVSSGSMSCTLFAFMGFMVAMCFLWAFLSLICDMFATRQKSR